jgi:hypothetical protein
MRKKPQKYKHQALPELSDAELLLIEQNMLALTQPSLTQKGNNHE